MKNIRMFIELTEANDNLKFAIPRKHIREVWQQEDGCIVIGKQNDYEVKESYEEVMTLIRKNN